LHPVAGHRDRARTDGGRRVTKCCGQRAAQASNTAAPGVGVAFGDVTGFGNVPIRVLDQGD
jgi:hypothetical protein